MHILFTAPTNAGTASMENLCPYLHLFLEITA